jgi:hypothetical protein
MNRSLAKLLMAPIWLASVALTSAGLIALSGAGGAWAQDCEKMSGPARTDCFIGRARIRAEQSDIAAGAARLRSSQERLRAVTGGSFEPRRLKTKPKAKHKARRHD